MPWPGVDDSGLTLDVHSNGRLYRHTHSFHPNQVHYVKPSQPALYFIRNRFASFN